jgi:glycine betaine catabolism B
VTSDVGEDAEFAVAFTISGKTIACKSSGFVLDAALAAGLKLPFACRRGLCGTCKSKLISGRYDMKHLGGIRPKEIEAGLFLPCCSKPLSDLVIEK